MMREQALLPRKAAKRMTFGQIARALARNRSGIMLVEFAYSIPFMMLFASNGLELANWVMVRRR